MTPMTQTTTDTDTEPVVEMRRTFKAPRDKVFAAWTTADALAAWMGPKSVTARIETLDLVPGGAYRLVMVGENEHIATGTYLEIEPPERLAFTWTWEGGDFAGIETIVEITLAEVEAGTELTLVHRRLPSDSARELHTEGWTGSFECLDAFLAG